VKENLAKKGRQIVEELGAEDQRLLKKWMAHYVAELMQRSESGNDEEAQSAADRCAELIVKLWEMKLKEQELRLGWKLHHWLGRTDEEGEGYYERLKHALACPEKVKTTEPANVGVTLWSLSELEKSVIEFLWVSEALNAPDSEVLDEALQRLAQSDSMTQMIRQQVAEFFPAFADLSLSDRDGVLEQVTTALRTVDQVRHVLLWQDDPQHGHG